MDQLLFATYSAQDLALYRRRAEQLRCGLELHTFTDPAVLSGDVKPLIEIHKELLQDFQGPLGFHGAFYDMVSGSSDPDIVAVTRRRYRQNLSIAAALKGQYVVFHANYLGTFKLANYRAGWHRRQVKFWQSFADEAAEHDILVLLENMWADDPAIIADVLAEVDRPNFLACLDVAHAVLFSNEPITAWIEALQPRLFGCHVNNTDGRMDLHWPLGHGIIDYVPILNALRQLANPPRMILEMSDWPTIEESLSLFDLRRQP